MSELARVIEDLPLATYLFRVVDGDFLLEGVSAAARDINPSIPTFFGRSMTHLYRDQPEAFEAAQRCVREQSTVVRESVVRRYDQTEATQRMRLIYVFVAPDSMLIFVQMLPSEQLSEASFRESEARYRSLVASVPDGLLVRGPDGRVLACNDVFVSMVGFASQADLLGNYQVLAPGYQVEVAQSVAGRQELVAVEAQDLPSARVIRSGQPEYGQPYVLRRPDGTRRYIRVSAQPIRGSEGKVTGSVTLFTDYTEQRELEEELRRAHRLESIGRLAGGIAHDFNNLLAAIMGSLELLEDVVPAAGRADLDTVRHASLRARDLTHQLLAFARKQPVEFKPIELTALVGSVERMLRRLVGPNVELVLQLDHKATVHADAAQLEQVLVNLVVNASEAMPHGGRLHVRVAHEPPALALLEVSDSGVGMDRETQRRVFDPFFTTKEQGTGLGLASSYGIIKQHGGDIVVDSDLGVGTRFRVLLPSVAGAQTKSEHAPAAQPAAEERWVLLIDDEQMVRSTTARMLESLGYRVLSAASAEEGLTKSRAHAGALDILLCDVAMPVRSGPSIAAELLRERPSLRVIFVSGYAPEISSDLPRGALYLQKPFRRAELAAKLSELMS